MAEVIQLESFKRKQAATRGFKSWSKRFGDKLDEQTRLSDLADNTLLFLISPGDQVKNLGTASDFFHLNKVEKMEVIDISIYVLDQLRFECMRRLDWLESGAGQPLPIIELVEQYPLLKGLGPASIPPLNESHPKYQVYSGLPELERETFLRKQIPEAINEFGKRLQD
jgi:hypothetical protein